EWIHVAFTIDAATNNAQFYVNGVPTNDTGILGGDASGINFDVPNSLYVGQQDPAHNVNRASFDGQIREVMLFNRALSADDIQNIYSSTRPAGATPTRR